ncbi:hypothetical protein HK19_12910 [Acetobacter persici]|uniref:hypothetical protein n=1 Tax=Acetobacter persici TaxID=1076596 RepID=UPI000A39C1B2|nr:hypothetical protein [Acetobacter persici]OUI90091.1 hypothetical protein HK19_12910 [Acetobacter persici]
MAANNIAKHTITEQIQKRFQEDLEHAFKQYVAMLTAPNYNSSLQRDAEENNLANFSQDNHERNMSVFMQPALKMLREAGYDDATENSQRARVLSAYLAERAGLLAEARLHWIDGEEEYRPQLRDLPEELFPPPQHKKTLIKEDVSKPQTKPSHTPVPIRDILTTFMTERDFLEKSQKERIRVVDTFCDITKKDDATTVTAEDAILWKKTRLGTKTFKGENVKPQTIKRDLSVLKSLWDWGKANRLLSFTENPFRGIAPRQKKGTVDPVRPYTGKEAKWILENSRCNRKPFLRWAPWVLAYTGLRLKELMYLRKEHICIIKDINVINLIATKDRPLKTPQSSRIIPLHKDLIKEGFLTYVDSLQNGSLLFPEVTPDTNNDLSGNASKLLGYWIRKKLHIDDPTLSPAHSWRHLFIDMVAMAGATPDIADALSGHEVGTGSARSGYGEGARRKPWETVKIIEKMKSLINGEWE